MKQELDLPVLSDVHKEEEIDPGRRSAGCIADTGVPLPPDGLVDEGRQNR